MPPPEPHPGHARRSAAPELVPKVLGRDAELSTTGIDPEGRPLDPYDVACAVLDEVEPVLARRDVRVWRPLGEREGGASSRDTLRQWTATGQGFYCDLGHVELCTAEVRSARELAAQSLAALRIVEEARREAEAAAPVGTRLSLTTANLDATDPEISWGTHLNVAVSEALWDVLFREGGTHGEGGDPATVAYVAGALAAGAAFFGTGAVLADPEGPLFSLSSRALHVTRLVTTSTTEAFRRGLLNARREPHAGPGIDRLHLIAFDHAIASAALLGVYLQAVLAAAELGILPGPILRRPVASLWAWSAIDPTKPALACARRTIDGRDRTLPAFVRDVVEPLIALCETGVLPEEIVPEGRELLPRIVALADHLEQGAFRACAPHLDWVLKLLRLQDACERHGLSFGDLATRALDHDFTNTDPSVGPFFELWSAGLVDPLVSHDDVERFLISGPRNTRASTRGLLVQRFHDQITEVDWSYVELARAPGRFAPRARVVLEQPHADGRDELETCITGARNVEDLLRALRLRDPRLVQDVDPVEGTRRRVRDASRHEE